MAGIDGPPRARFSSMTIQRAILIAAGVASASAPQPRRSESAWSRSAGKPILGWAWQALASVGVDELS